MVEDDIEYQPGRDRCTGATRKTRASFVNRRDRTPDFPIFVVNVPPLVVLGIVTAAGAMKNADDTAHMAIATRHRAATAMLSLSRRVDGVLFQVAQDVPRLNLRSELNCAAFSKRGVSEFPVSEQRANEPARDFSVDFGLFLCGGCSARILISFERKSAGWHPKFSLD